MKPYSLNRISVCVTLAVALFVLVVSFKSSRNFFAEKMQYSVSPAGDVNGDGYADVVMSIHTSEKETEGKVFLYYGAGKGMGNMPGWTGNCNQADANYGVSIANAGDVNGDGYADVIVGASHYSNGETNEGAAFVYYGSASGLSKTPSWTAEGSQANAFFGISVAGNGDVNKDGYADVIIGAHYYDNGETNEGRVFVYYGSANGLSKTPVWTAESNQVGAAFGKTVAIAGDVNHDGYADVLVGSPSYDNGQNNEGRAFLYYGSVMGLATSPSWTGESNQADANFGNAMAPAGDLNGDGFSDIVVGANKFDEKEKSNAGKIFVYLGSANGYNYYPDWTYSGNQIDGNLGISVSGAGDINGDGFQDMIVGAYGYNPDAPKGNVYVFYGSRSGFATTMVQISNQDYPHAILGQSVAVAGDINGDGYADIIPGAILDNDNMAKAMLLKGSAKGLLMAGAAGGKTSSVNP